MSTARAVKPLWDAIFAVIENLTVAGLGAVEVKETPAPGTPFPYVTFSVAFPEHRRAEGVGALQTDVWDTNNVERIIAIQDALAALLDGCVLTWSGGTATLFASSTPPIGRDPDGSTRHGVQIYRVLVHT